MAAAGKWRCFRAVLQARAPIHIGWHELGLIQRTRYYIPARAMWGLLVAGLTPRLKSGPELQYEATARDLEDCLRFTCFFPATDPSDDSQLFRPKYVEKRGITYGELTAAEFESRLVYSQTSAALEPMQLSALDGALHESEFLSPVDPKEKKGVHFVGYLVIHESLDTKLVEDTLRHCCAGADRHYGWGDLQLRGKLRDAGGGPVFETLRYAGGCEFMAPSGGPHYLPAHLACDGAESGFEGALEAVSGRDWCKTDGPGRASQPRAELCWAPGTRVANEGTDIRFEIGAKGLWTRVG